MSFSLNQLGLIVFGYLGVLFATAYAVERNWVPRVLGTPPAGVHFVSGGIRQRLGVLWLCRAGVSIRLMVFSPITLALQARLSCRRFCSGRC